MKPILLIQFRSDKTVFQERECFKRYLLRGIKMEYLDAFKDGLVFSHPRMIGNYQAVILGGSGELYFSKNNKGQNFQKIIKRISFLLNYILEYDFPTLGVCFGHQILGSFLGTEVVADSAQAEVGSFTVLLTKEGQKSKLFSGFPKNFIAQFGHKDSLKKLPQGASLLAKSKKCQVAAFSYKKNIYGVQFHPELNLDDVKFRLSLRPEYKEKKRIPLLASPLAKQVLNNFFRKIAYDNR